METIITPQYIARRLKTRQPESHKGDYGRAIIVAGSRGMMGAALLATRACMRSGVGLLTAAVPACGYEIMQFGVPEAKCICDTDSEHHTYIRVPADTEVLAIGPGIGQSAETQEALRCMLEQCCNLSMVIDADALNILALHPEWFALVPRGSIVTPHPGEMKRMAEALKGKTDGPAAMAERYGIVVVLKGHHTRIYTPEGECIVNTLHGNAGMAVGGSGDVLTGIILALMAQHYAPAEAAALGVWMHAFAADLALQQGESQESLLPSDIIKHLGQAFTLSRKG